MNPTKSRARVLFIIGGIAMLVGAIDPLEGSLLILPGAGLMALGAFRGRGKRREVAYRVSVFVLIAIGVVAMWALSTVGGFGGTTGRSYWWGVLVVPYMMGWSMGIWGPRSPRWLVWLGMAVSFWYLVLLAMTMRAPVHPGGPAAAIALGVVGLLTIGGCLYRLSRRKPERT